MIAEPQGVTSIDEKSGAKQNIDGRRSATKTVQPTRRRKMQKRDAQKKVNRRCSATKTVQPAPRISKKKIYFNDEETRAILLIHGINGRVFAIPIGFSTAPKMWEERLSRLKTAIVR